MVDASELGDGGFAPKVLDELFPAADFALLQQYVEKLAGLPDLPADVERGRHYLRNLSLMVDIHRDMKDLVSRVVGFELKPSYTLLSFYGPRAVVERHLDRPQCEVTLTYCISQDQPLDLYVGDGRYRLEENQALVFAGRRQPHHRDPIQSEYCRMALFHFVRSDFFGSLD